jgi:hypothetical protein
LRFYLYTGKQFTFQAMLLVYEINTCHNQATMHSNCFLKCVVSIRVYSSLTEYANSIGFFLSCDQHRTDNNTRGQIHCRQLDIFIRKILTW